MHCSRSLHGLAAAVACALLTAPVAFAASAPTSTTATGENTPLHLERPAKAVQQDGGGGGIVRTIVGLAVVIGVIYGLHWVLKQVKTGREQRSTGGGLNSLSTLQLGPGRALHLVRAGSEIVLLGAAEHGVTPIRVYSEDEARTLGLLDDVAALDGDDRGGAGGPAERPNPLRASGSPATVRDVLRTVQGWTVRR
jgi:flagellar protein FliO/FliZ